MTQAGLLPHADGNLPIPFESWRAAARSLGLKPRMPGDEAAARAHRIAYAVNDQAIAGIAASARAHGTPVIALGLNVVIDDAPEEVPNAAAFASAGIPMLDMFDVFPEAERPALRVAPWDDHPNAAGHRLIAERLYRELVPRLNQLPSNAE
jgi:lysophospholipase L1-like esterase